MPVLYVIAGPNGIGKTTSSVDMSPKNIPLINSDEIAKEVRSAKLISSNTQEYSNREASRLVNEQLNKRASFAIETNLADVETWKFLIEVQRLGYELHVKYISTSKLKILNDRIKERVLLGEHYVRPDIVEERYITSLKLLNHYFEYPDVIELFDNSVSMKLIAEIRKGKTIFTDAYIPEWVNEHLPKVLQPNTEERRLSETYDIDSVRKRYQAMKNKDK